MGCGQEMEYSLSGFLSKLALNKLDTLLIEEKKFPGHSPSLLQPSVSNLGFEESACIKARPKVFFQAQRISKFSVLVPCDKDGYLQFFWFKLFQVSYF